MIKKILTFSVVLAMALVMLTGNVAGAQADQLQGATQDSASGVLLDEGNVSVVHVQDPGDIPMYNGDMGDTGSGYATYQWDATVPGDAGWASNPPVDDDLYFIKEASGCIAATHATVTDTTSVKDDQFDMIDRLETIPVPEENEEFADPANDAVGETWINISIPAFKYTDYNGGASSGQGTFDVVSSYAVFMSENGGAWTHVGNAENFTAGPDSPLVPMSGGDPATTDTGHYYMNVTGLTAGTDYEFKIRVNIGPTGTALGGYDGGLGSYTTWGAGASSPTISTKPADTPEFPNVLIPVVATIGVFAAITIYRKKKYE